MICPNCRSSNPDGTRFCMTCGSPLSAPQTPASTPPVPQQTIKKRSKGPLIAGIAAAALLLAAGAVFLLRAGVIQLGSKPAPVMPEPGPAVTQPPAPAASEKPDVPAQKPDDQKQTAGKKPDAKNTEKQDAHTAEADFPAISGVWYDPSGEVVLTIYENGGFALAETGGFHEGYLVFTEEDGGLWESGPRYAMYLEDNTRLYDSAHLVTDDAYPGTLTFAYGAGAQLLTRDKPDTEPVPVNLQAIWFADADWLTDYDTFTAETSDVSVQVVFTVDRAVRDFKVLALAVEHVDENGMPSYSRVERYTQPELTPGTPLVVEMVFYGTFPNNGVSYLDEDGQTRTFVVSISGMDGSLLLQEL